MNTKNLSPFAFALAALAGSAAESTELEQNCPNPFNAETCIAFEIEEQQRVHLRVYDLNGRLVKILVDGENLAADRYEKFWDGRDNAGRGLAAGVYIYRLDTPDYHETRRMLLTH